MTGYSLSRWHNGGISIAPPGKLLYAEIAVNFDPSIGFKILSLMTGYIKQHWYGKFSLAHAFWMNFVLLYVILEILGLLLYPPYIENEIAVAIGLTGFILVTKVIVYSWQVVGVLRVCAQRIKSNTGRLWAMVAQTVVAGSLVITLVLSLDSYQALRIYQEKQASLRVAPEIPSYTIEVLKGGRLLHLQGPLQIGITAKVEKLLQQNREVSGIILDSVGGQIYEGRGLARLITDYRLQTFSLDKCLSSCTTAFVAGTVRSLGTGAKLGFHQYKTYSLIPSINVKAEHAKDMAIFVNQGISPEFLEKIFQSPPEAMWWPEIGELVSAGVVHQTGFTLAD